MNELNGTELEMEPEGGLMPEQDEVSRPAVVDTKGIWTCAECGTANGGDTGDCFECGTPKPAEAAVEPAPTPASKPEDVPLPLNTDGEDDEAFERFNPNKAMSAIIAKNIEVQASRDKHDSLKKAAAEAKKTLDQDEAALGRIISQFARARESQNSPQAMLPLNGQPAAIDSNCPWERDNPGHVCVVCREATKHKLNPDVNSEVHPEHVGHEEVADKAHTEKVLKPLIPALKAKGLHLTLMDVYPLQANELQQLLDWVDQAGIVPPAILTTSHLADLPGSVVQLCKTCGVVLADMLDEEGLYPEGARVGLDCSPELDKALEAIDEVIPAEPVEAARKPKSHAKKNAAKKREPEAERKHQVEAGKKKAAPKAKKGGRK